MENNFETKKELMRWRDNSDECFVLESLFSELNNSIDKEVLEKGFCLNKYKKETSCWLEVYGVESQ